MGHDGNVRADRENAKNQNCADDGGDRTPSVKPNATNAIDAQCHAPLPTTYPLDAADDVCSATPSCDAALRGYDWINSHYAAAFDPGRGVNWGWCQDAPLLGSSAWTIGSAG